MDAEDTSLHVDDALVARHFLSPRERSRLAKLGPRERVNRFFEQWVLKEAYVKATGRALGASPERLTIVQRRDGRPAARGKCQFALWRPNAEHVAAAAVIARRDAVIEFEALEAEIA